MQQSNYISFCDDKMSAPLSFSAATKANRIAGTQVIGLSNRTCKTLEYQISMKQKYHIYCYFKLMISYE